MLILMQILRRLNKEELEMFGQLFHDFGDMIEELNDQGHESQVLNDMLGQYFGFQVDDDYQIKSLTEVILANKHLSALKVEKMRFE